MRQAIYKAFPILQSMNVKSILRDPLLHSSRTLNATLSPAFIFYSDKAFFGFLSL